MITALRSSAGRRYFCALAISLVWATWAHAGQLDDIDADAMSGDPDRIRRSIDAYAALDAKDDVDVLWRLLRAYYNYYDEYTERDRGRQRWAADRGWKLAKSKWEQFPENAEFVYFKAVVGVMYKDFHWIRGPGLGKVRRAWDEARRLDPTIDDGGPDRRLGLSYLFPLSKDTDKALLHLHEAVRIDPDRAANRLGLAKALAEAKRFEEGWPHVQAVRTGELKVSSDHWKDLYRVRVEVVADEFPQNRQ